MTKTQRILWPLGVGLAGALLLFALYFAILSWAESPGHALELFWQDRWLVLPILVGFGVQAALYTILRKRLFIPAGASVPGGHLVGAGGGTSAVAMVACCAHHVSDVLPFLGLSAAAAFLAEYRPAFLAIGLVTNLLGILVMLVVLSRARRRAVALEAT